MNAFGKDDADDVDYGWWAHQRDLAAMTEAEVLAEYPDEADILDRWEDAKERIETGRQMAYGYLLIINERANEVAA